MTPDAVEHGAIPQVLLVVIALPLHYCNLGQASKIVHEETT